MAREVFVIRGDESYCPVVEDEYPVPKADEVEPTPLKVTAEQLSKCMHFQRQAGKVEEKQLYCVGKDSVEKQSIVSVEQQPCSVGRTTVKEQPYTWSTPFKY